MLPIVVSLLFFLASTFYFFSGIYVFHLNKKSLLHLIFFLICLSLFIWTFTLSVSISAQSPEVCLNWRRLSVIGWGMFSSLFLHFNLILTGQCDFLRKKWGCLLLYLPCVINIAVFGIIPQTALNQMELIYTDVGWISIPNSTIWEYWYRVYYISFVLLSIILVYRWGARADQTSVKYRAKIIMLAYTLSFLTGSLTDIVINTYTAYKTPELAPVLMIATITAGLLCIKKYGLMNARDPNTEDISVPLLSQETRNKLIDYLSVAYLFSSFVVFGGQYFSGRESLHSALAFNAVLFTTGLVLHSLQGFPFKLSTKDRISNIIMAATIPLVLYRYADYAAIIAWSVPIILVLVSVAFGQKRTFFVISGSVLITLLTLWILEPEQTLTFTGLDHLYRLMIFFIILWLARYINHIYVLRLEQYEKQLRLQTLNAKISMAVASMNETNYHEKMQEVPRVCGEHISADRVELVFFHDERHTENTVFEWCGSATESMSAYYKAEGADQLLRLTGVHDRSARSQSGFWSRDGKVCSVMAVPLAGPHKTIGLLMLESLTPGRKFPNGFLPVMQIISRLLSDVWMKIEAEIEITHMAYHDILTGLPNRMLLGKRMEKELSCARENGNIVAAIYLDLDFFKNVNDNLGHGVGDVLLEKISSRIFSCLHKEDTIARFGGDEFLLMLPKRKHRDEIMLTAEAIIDKIKEPLRIDGQELAVTASMGIAVYPDDGYQVEDLIKNADLALHISKRNGRNRYTVCSGEIKQEFHAQNEMRNCLYRAVERNELEMHYQPKIECHSGNIIGVEALVRWNHPEKGLVYPQSFIPLAEEVGIIHSIDQWVLSTACRQLKRWREKGLPSIMMAVNLSLSQIYREDIVKSIASLLTESGLDPRDIELEITESISCYEAEDLAGILNGLKSLGLSIAIDDFGMGYSSLSRLYELPIDRIKIDRRFIYALSEGVKGEGVLRAILKLGKALGLKITAEGVETAEQLAFVKALQCDEIQGYYFYKPMPAGEIESLLLGQSQ